MERTLGRYRVLERIGAGGMGEVYRARDDQLDRDVALKLLPASALSDPTARAHLIREARTASQLNHPHICTIYEVGEADGQSYIAMECVEGRPLSARLAGRGLSPEEVLRIGTQIADGLAHAHEQGVVHRDLKSANVMVTPSGRVKVLDFGLAKRVSGEAVGEAPTEASLTAPHTLAGTVAYMAPEQLRGQAADARSDVWALGVVLYEMVTGTRPFSGQTGYELSSAILSQPVPSLPASAPGPLRGVIARCLEKEPARRYQHGGEVQAALEALERGTAPALPWRHRLPRRPWLVATASVAAVVVLLVALDVGGVRARLLGGAAAPRIDSVAVLPLENLSGDPEQDFLAAGMHEELITQLAKLGGLKRVIARASVMRFKGTDRPPSEIARELGVEALVTGAVVQDGDRVRVTAQLIDARTDEHLWADRYERSRRDVLALQSDIVASVAREIRLSLTDEERAHLAVARPVDPEAHEAYLKGMFHLNQFTPEGYRRGLEYLTQAIAIDPTDARAYAGLAIAYNTIGHGPAPLRDASGAWPDYERAKAAADQALALDDTIADAHVALAQLKLTYEWDWPGAEAALQRAMELDPSRAEALMNYGWYLDGVGRTEEALEVLRRAQEVDPLTPTYSAVRGWILWWADERDAAIEEAEKALELERDFPVAHALRGFVLAEQGRYDEAIQAHRRAGPIWGWGLGYAQALAGQTDEARRLAAELERARPLNPWGLAELYAALNEKDEALRWLKVAYDTRHTWMPWVKENPPFDPLHGDPRFEVLVPDLGLR